MEIMQEKDKPALKGNGLIVADPFESLGFVRPLIGLHRWQRLLW
jgi:hypothetical protein